MKQKEAIKLIIETEKGKGRVEDLRTKIGAENFNQLCLMGLIKRGVASIDNEPVQTWAITDSLKEEYKFFYGKLSNEDKAIANRYAPARFH